MNAAAIANSLFDALAKAREKSDKKILPKPQWIEVAVAVIASAMPKPREKREPISRGKELSDEAWVAYLKTLPVYRGIDVDREIQKCEIWSKTKRKKLSRDRIVNWLNGADVPLTLNSPPRPVARPVPPEPENWFLHFSKHFPLSPYAAGGSLEECSWKALPSDCRNALIEELGKGSR